MYLLYNTSVFSVILARPESSENIGLVARAMKNTGFKDLRLAGIKNLKDKAFKTAVHAEDVLKDARRYPDLDAALADLHVVFAATAKARTNFSSLTFEDALDKMRAYPPSMRIGLLFGNERTGLTSEEMRHSNFRFTIPQASRQPSYNLAAAVLLTLFPLVHSPLPVPARATVKPLPRKDQDECIRRILEILKARRFMHETNQAHVTEMIHDLFGRLAMTDRDRRLLLAIFYKGSAGRANKKGV